jgi:hypothetical protein
MFITRAIVPFRPFFPSISRSFLPVIRPSVFLSHHVRFGSMKVKRIQKKKPLEKNRIRRLIKGTKLDVKKIRKKKARNTDPNAYLDVKEVEFDRYDLRGRTTLTVCSFLSPANSQDSQIHACVSRSTTSSTTSS